MTAKKYLLQIYYKGAGLWVTKSAHNTQRNLDKLVNYYETLGFKVRILEQ